MALVGPTGSGKTAVSELLADSIGAEIVCADSRQVFRDLDVGTGKPSPEERAQRAHHLFDALALGDRASAGWYARACVRACDEIHARGHIPLLVGGSGLYLRAASGGLFHEPPIDPEVRAELRELADAGGVGALHEELTRVDPVTAARVRPRDRQRIVRALEVHRSTGRPLSAWHQEGAQTPGGPGWIWLGLELPAATLGERIDRRARWMFEHGLVEETQELLARKRRDALIEIKAIGYLQAMALIEGTMDTERAIAETALRTRQLAKRQRTWFRHQARVEWITVEEGDTPSALALRLSRRLQSLMRQGGAD